MIKKFHIKRWFFFIIVIFIVDYFWFIPPSSVDQIHIDTLQKAQALIGRLQVRSSTAEQLQIRSIDIGPSWYKIDSAENAENELLLGSLKEKMKKMGADRLLFVKRKDNSESIRLMFYRPLSFLSTGAWSVLYTSNNWTEEEQVPDVASELLRTTEAIQNFCEPTSRPPWFICFNRHN
jgi:hypothetical protein